MDKHISKVPVYIALGLSAASFALVTAGWFIGRNEPADIPGVGSALWIGSVAAAACAVLLYFRDAVRAAALAKEHIRPRFNGLRAVILFLGVPMGFLFGLRPGWSILIWNGYHVGMCGFEVAWLMMHPEVDL